MYFVTNKYNNFLVTLFFYYYKKKLKYFLFILYKDKPL